MIQVTPTLAIPDNELAYEFIRASGPGGQNVNKVATAVQLRYEVRSSAVLSQTVRQRLEKIAGSRMTQEGVLVIEAKRYRTQEQNKADAEERLAEMVRAALYHPRPRHPTHPTTSSVQRRVEGKKRRGMTKRFRQGFIDKD